MPELPEVEVVRRGLDANLVGHRITAAHVLHPRAARNQPGGAPEIETSLDGLTVTAARRRGKFCWLLLADTTPGSHRAPHTELALLVHLGMSGQMLVKTPGAETSPHLRAYLELDDGKQIWFVDQRTFGYWWVGPVRDGVPERVAHIAMDLLDQNLDVHAAARLLKSRPTEIKRLLLNQEIVSGIGNIYADEMLWEAGIHPMQNASRVSLNRLRGLLMSGIEVMNRALAEGGTSFDSLYINVNGNSGYFSRSLQAYGRTGKPCLRCGTALRRIVIGGRSSHFCPRCQRRR
ncbi:bifunctional DNA-formamidopyrimidine glycosylase/DNA-(apurinic or apyrimidinic site) lyase [Corynebacterium pacaense]|uniref:bifunctional DNA-formamidopyrimidine glycosylase/DNA-(apurinic or apyrimidinic site) lyase n=1 Tax=Corynebacterium pacaense TaxID=1816684 RepID=UPI0009BBD6B2|nr:bifunctional DNA-formamidopyrimidine glycosylase/DNA-(apurinic or apyrimidinic site) lyase [Corynebacterium pacaense]